MASKEVPKGTEDPLVPTEMKEMFEEVAGEGEEGKVIGDLFYRSVKGIFDTGFELAKKLNFELMSDSVRKALKKGKK